MGGGKCPNCKININMLSEEDGTIDRNITNWLKDTRIAGCPEPGCKESEKEMTYEKFIFHLT
jgi:hypothetical protein